MPVITYRQALTDALIEEMDRDPDVFVIGEDVGSFGGSFRVTEGLLERYGSKRVVDTPIAEMAIVGMGVGAAMGGIRPVVEIMTVNFALQAFDQIVNNAAHIRYMFGGQISVPLVIRTPGGAGHQLSAQHSHSFEALFSHIPGLVVVCPAVPADAKAMLKAAIRDDNPTLFLENEGLYNSRGEVPDGEHLLGCGKAAVLRQGSDVSLIALSRMTPLALDAAQQLAGLGIDAEVIDLRSLRPIDWDTLVTSVHKTARALVVEEGWPSFGVSAEISAGLTERAFDDLDAAVARLGGAEVPMPYNKALERAALPSPAAIVKRVQQLMGGI